MSETQPAFHPLQGALQQLCPCTVLTEQLTRGQARFQFRVAPENTEAWLWQAMRSLFMVAERLGINCDLSKSYIPQPNGDFKWTWRLILQHADVEAQLPLLAEQLGAGQKARTAGGAVEVQAVRLNASATRNRTVLPVKG